jgi:hypothetical protein
MIPNLIEATNDYWRKLNELDAAYQRGEVSLEEVDTRVAELMAELGQARHETFRYLWHGLRHLWNQQREAIVGTACLGALTYTWLVIR